MQADDVAVVDRGVGVGDEVAEPQHAAGIHRLELPPHVRVGVGVGVLEEQRGLDAEDRERHRHRLVTPAGKHHLAALSEVDGDVGVERQPPVRQPPWVRDRIPDLADRVREVAFESDHAPIDGALQHAIVGGRGDVGHRFSSGLGGIGVAVRRRCRSSESSRAVHSARYGSSHASSSISGSGRSR